MLISKCKHRIAFSPKSGDYFDGVYRAALSNSSQDCGGCELDVDNMGRSDKCWEVPCCSTEREDGLYVVFVKVEEK